VDGTRVTLRYAYIARDSVIGTIGDNATFAVGVDRVARLEQWKFSLLRTGGLVVGVPAGFLGVMALLCAVRGCGL